MTLLDRIISDNKLMKFTEDSIRLNYFSSQLHYYMELDDFSQDCLLALHKCILKNEDYIKGFIVYNIKCVMKNDIKFYKTEKRKNLYNENKLSLDYSYNDEENFLNYYLIAPEEENEIKVYEEMLYPLKNYNYKWYYAFVMNLLGYKQFEIAEKMDISTKTVSKYIICAKNFLKEVV